MADFQKPMQLTIDRVSVVARLSRMQIKYLVVPLPFIARAASLVVIIIAGLLLQLNCPGSVLHIFSATPFADLPRVFHHIPADRQLRNISLIAALQPLTSLLFMRPSSLGQLGLLALDAVGATLRVAGTPYALLFESI